MRIDHQIYKTSISLVQIMMMVMMMMMMIVMMRGSLSLWARWRSISRRISIATAATNTPITTSPWIWSNILSLNHCSCTKLLRLPTTTHNLLPRVVRFQEHIRLLLKWFQKFSFINFRWGNIGSSSLYARLLLLRWGGILCLVCSSYYVIWLDFHNNKNQIRTYTFYHLLNSRHF